MKTLPLAQPRLACRLVRVGVSLFSDHSNGEPRGFGATHVAGCADCRQYFGACDGLGLALKHEADRARHEAPANLERDIMQAVSLSTRAPASGGNRVRLGWLVLAGTGACALLAVVIFYRQSATALSVGRPATSMQVAAAPTSPQEIWSALQPETAAVLDGDPLQNEVDAVVSDARTAMHFLALNFLPTAPETESGSG